MTIFYFSFSEWQLKQFNFIVRCLNTSTNQHEVLPGRSEFIPSVGLGRPLSLLPTNRILIHTLRDRFHIWLGANKDIPQVLHLHREVFPTAVMRLHTADITDHCYGHRGSLTCGTGGYYYRWKEGVHIQYSVLLFFCRNVAAVNCRHMSGEKAIAPKRSYQGSWVSQIKVKLFPSLYPVYI